MSRMTPYKVRLHVMSPVHIGCDDVYEPTGFVVDKAAKKLIAFDPLDFVRSLGQADRKKFTDICEKGTLESIVELYKFMATVKTIPNGKQINVSGGFEKIYETACRLDTRNMRKLKNELNQFKVERTGYLVADNTVYIPGSSLKGAIRTGWLNFLNQGKIHQIDDRDRKAAQKLESQLLPRLEGKDAIESDPFSMLKISDMVPVISPQTRICFAVNRKAGRTGGPYQILETISPVSVFEGIISVGLPNNGSKIMKPLPASRELFQKSSSFFVSEMEKEESMLKQLNISGAIRKLFEQKFGNQFMNTVYPIRIGRHCGAQCVTIDGARRIKIKNGRPAVQSKANSLWLAGDTTDASSNLLPFGWVALEMLELDPAAPLWPERVIPERKTAAAAAAAPVVKAPPPPPEQSVWEHAVLVWTPGNQTLSAQHGGTKAEVKLAADTSLVPEALHKKLFVKKEPVKAAVTVEKNGNAWMIVKVEATP